MGRADVHPHDLSDAELVAAVCSGDLAAAEHLFTERAGSIILFLSRKFQYDELLGDLFINLRKDHWKKLKTWSGAGSLSGWISQVCIRLCYTRIRELKRFVPVDADVLARIPDGRPGQHEDLVAARDRVSLLKAIETLDNPRDRLILRIVLFDSKSSDQAAAELGLKREHFYVLKGRAVSRLKERLGDAQHA